MGKCKRIDWDSIKPLYCAGSMSNCDICRQYAADHINSQTWKPTVAESAIRKKAKAKLWQKSIADKVQKRVREKLVRDEVRASHQNGERGSDEEIIERASDTSVNIILRHRDEIFELQAHEQRLLKRLQDTPKKLYHANFQGQIIEKEYSVTLNENSVTLKNLAAVRAQRIALERQAYSLGGSGDDEDPLKGLPDDQINSRIKILEAKLKK